MPAFHLQLVLAAVAGLALAVVLEIIRGRREEKLWREIRRRLA